MMFENHVSNAKQKHIFIAGAGIGGCFSALALAEKKNKNGMPMYRITLVDQLPDVLAKSSNVTPGRMGLGFHYAHQATALMYLRETLAFQRKYSQSIDFTVGADVKDPAIKHTLQHGRYFITKDSNTPKEVILNTYHALQAEYTRLVQEDPENKVFGEPEHFFRILEPAEYENDVNLDKVDIGIETPERLLDWKRFRKFLITKLNSHDNISILTNTTVQNISINQLIDQGACHYGVEISMNDGINEKHYCTQADFIVNCTWENARALNATAGLKRNDTRTNRLKALVMVKLPESLKNLPSAFFCMGPHAMFSNLGDGLGAMTYAPITSMMNSTDIIVPDTMKKYLDGNVTLTEKMTIAKAIINGVGSYLNGIEQAEIVNVQFGIVQTNGEVDIFDPQSAFHVRDYNGVTEEQLGFITNACMKLLYGPKNGDMVRDIIEEHELELTTIKQFNTSLTKFPSSATTEDKVDIKSHDLPFCIAKANTEGRYSVF